MSRNSDCNIYRKGEDRYAFIHVPDGPLLLLQHFRGVASLRGPVFDLLLVFDQSEPPAPDPSVLKAMFQFSTAEAAIGVLLSRGLTVSEVAEKPTRPRRPCARI